MGKRQRNQRRMPKDTPKRPPAYVSKLMEQAAPFLQPGTVTNWMVRHDDWCDLLNRRGPCNCDPDVRPIGHTGPYGAASGRN